MKLEFKSLYFHTVHQIWTRYHLSMKKSARMTVPIKGSQARNKEREAKGHSYIHSTNTSDLSVPVAHIALSRHHPTYTVDNRNAAPLSPVNVTHVGTAVVWWGTGWAVAFLGLLSEFPKSLFQIHTNDRDHLAVHSLLLQISTPVKSRLTQCFSTPDIAASCIEVVRQWVAFPLHIREFRVLTAAQEAFYMVKVFANFCSLPR